MVSDPPACVIADAGPLIVLSRIGKLDLLRQLFGTIQITDVVRHELLGRGTFQGQQAIAAALTQWLREVTVDMAHWSAIHPGVDLGEGSSICLAEQRPNSLLIIDDRVGRLEAQMRNLHYIGLPGIVVQAKQMGRITAVRPLLFALQQAGYFISDTLIDQLVQKAGEC